MFPGGSKSTSRQHRILAAASAVSLLAAGGAQASQIWYTTSGVSNVLITNRPSGQPNLFLPNISIRFSVVGETSGAYTDATNGVLLIPATSPIATVSGAGTGTVTTNGFHFPFSFTNNNLGLSSTAPGEVRVFADGFGAYDGVYAYGSVTGSLVDLGEGFTGPGLAGWDGVSALASTPVSLRDGSDTPSLDLVNGASWNFLNIHDATFSAIAAGGSAATPLVVVGGSPDATSYAFNFSATGGVPVYVDPLVATGYDYVVGSGPLITSAMFPTVGSSSYSIYALNDLSTPLFSNVLGGQTVDFTTVGYADGIAGFELRGVDVGAGVNPNDSTAFVTALTFAGSGTVNLTQTALTTFVSDAVPEPATWAMLILGFFGLGQLRRRRTAALAA